MNPDDLARLGRTLKRKRQHLGLSASEVARRAGVTPSTVTRIEAAQFATPQPESLKAIAAVLELPVSDLFTVVDWLPKGELPTFAPYLRSKYRDLPPEAMAKLEQSFGRIAKRYGYESSGPAPGEDEV
jgi:transcriptional regulator with XRE-family HTH domain